MTHNAWKSFITGSLILLATLSLSACNLPGLIPSATPTAIPTVTMIPRLTPTPILPTATVPAATTSPSPTAPIVPDVSLITFHMVDALNGWGASDQMALRTVDGGKTWQNVTPADMPAGIGPDFQVAAISPQAAWMIVPDASDFKKGTLYRTTDGGHTWQNRAVPFGGGWVQFLDDKKYAVMMADRGVAAGSQAVDLYQTSDGGATWNLIFHVDPQNPANNGIPFGGDKSGVTFLDSAHGWVTGFSPVDGGIYVYATQDSGKTWQQVQLNLPAGWQQAQIESKPPVFFGGQDGIMPLRASTNVGQIALFVTHDRGETWQATTPLAAYGQISMPSAKDVIVWDGTTLHYSTDAGQTWQERTPNVDLSQGLIGMQFIDRDTGWALNQDANGSRLYRTTDGGSTWQ
jgi:photosystem II stability/assembly factor-like uncharacterized protein